MARCLRRRARLGSCFSRRAKPHAWDTARAECNTLHYNPTSFRARRAGRPMRVVRVKTSAIEIADALDKAHRTR